MPFISRMRVAVLVLLTGLFAVTAYAQDLSPYYFAIGAPSLRELYVDVNNGSDGNAGTSPSAPLKTVRAAWRRIPSSSQLRTGYRINILPGEYTEDDLPGYWELKRGTYDTPVIVRAASGRGTVRFTHDVNMANVSYVYLIDLEIVGGGNTFHCEGCDHLLLRGNTIIGALNGRNSSPVVAREAIKVNQSQYIYIENNVVRGADDNAIDWVAVQYGHIVGNTLSDTEGWCLYVKGGSAYVRIEGNELYDCFEGGITAGQGTGLEFTVAPWFRYEAYDVKIINNVVHDVQGAALGVNGGYNILLAHNTAYRVGSRSHLIEVVFGLRSCDGDSAACAARLAAGAWGTATQSDEATQPIGNRNVKVLNNLIYNPPGYRSGTQHFTIDGLRVTTDPSVPSPQRTDEELEIRGNLIWNGDDSMPLGVGEEGDGCQQSNPNCNAAQLRATNSINQIEPHFLNGVSGDYRPAEGSAVFQYPALTMNPFPARGVGEVTPEGVLENVVLRDRSGVTDLVPRVGAYWSTQSALAPPDNDGVSPPGTPRNGGDSSANAPVIRGLKAVFSSKRSGYVLTVTFRASGKATIRSARASIGGRALKLTRRGTRYTGSRVFPSLRSLTVTVVVTDATGERTTKVARV